MCSSVLTGKQASKPIVPSPGLEARTRILGRIRGTLKREPLLNTLLALLKRDLIQRVYIPKGPPSPIPHRKRRMRVLSMAWALQRACRICFCRLSWVSCAEAADSTAALPHCPTSPKP